MRKYTPQKEADFEEKKERKSEMKTQGRKGCKAERINMAFSPENYEFIKICSKATGKTMTEFTNILIKKYREKDPSMIEKASKLLKAIEKKPREIVYRGKSLYGRWCYGYLNQHRGDPIFDVYCDENGSCDYYIYDWVAKIDTGCYGEKIKVIPETIGQFTGRKIKEYKNIYEGDFLTNGRGTGFVEYNEHDCCFYVHMNNDDLIRIDDFVDENTEITGTIYDEKDVIHD